MTFTCDNCRFIFQDEREPEQCPDCGKRAVRPATAQETEELKQRIDETSIFKFDEKTREYEAELNGVHFICAEVLENYPAKVAQIAGCYESRLSEIAEFMMDEITQLFGEMTESELVESLGKPTIDLDRETLSFLEQVLDDEHIIEMEYSGDLDQFYYLNIDG